jgi:hypothetical protein
MSQVDLDHVITVEAVFIDEVDANLYVFKYQGFLAMFGLWLHDQHDTFRFIGLL